MFDFFVKAGEPSVHRAIEVWDVLKAVGSLARRTSTTLDVTAVHAAHADYVWTTLARMGVAPSDLPDMLQEVFVVVHRKAHTYDGTSKIRTWLYGISLGVARNYRRKAHRRRELPAPELDEREDLDRRGNPEAEVSRDQARRELSRLLDALDPNRRAVFVMFELEEMSCDQIACTLDIPVGTVYSRLHKARAELKIAISRRNEKEDCP